MILTTVSIPLVFLLVVIVFISIAIYSAVNEKKRRNAMQLLADSLHFRFSADKDRHLPKRFHFLEDFGKGNNRYAQNVFTGQANGEAITFFEYHFETTSRDSEGETTTYHHYFSVFTLSMPRNFPELVVKPEGLFAKLGQALGFDDIDFESYEFSKRYEVKSKDKKFAYDFCNGSMIDYLLNKPNLVIEVENQTLALTHRGKFSTQTIQHYLNDLQTIRSLMPDYLFSSP